MSQPTLPPTTDDEIRALGENGLYDPAGEHDACGVGFVAHIKGEKSHSIIEQGLKILENLDHRGAVGADELMGDGAGILIQLPDEFYRAEMAASGQAPDGRVGVHLPPPGEYGVGMIFLPKEHASRLACEHELERAVKAEGQVLLGWREVPVDRDMPMSPTVRAKEPVIRQIFIGRGADVIVPDALERKLYVIRKTASAAIQKLRLTHSREYYVPSMSCRTVIYKGLLLANQVGSTTATWPTRVPCRHWPWCTSASRPTPSPSGRWPTPTGWWRTTARSTPSRATSTGCVRARA
jgi:glutamate synthase (NADPH/NADH) large chain